MTRGVWERFSYVSFGWKAVIQPWWLNDCFWPLAVRPLIADRNTFLPLESLSLG